MSNFRIWIGSHVLKIKKAKKIITNVFNDSRLNGLKSYLNLSTKRTKSLVLGFKLLVGRKVHFDAYKTHLDIFFLRNQYRSSNKQLIYQSFLYNIELIYKVILIEWIRRLWFTYKYVSRWHISNKNFRRYHLRSYYHNKVFAHNKFYYYMYINASRRNQKFFRKFLKYYYMVKHLNHKVRTILYNSGTLSLFYIKILSNHLVPSNWRLNFKDYNNKYTFEKLKKTKYIYSNYSFFLKFRDSCVWDFKLKQFRSDPYRRYVRKIGITQNHHKNIIYNSFDNLLRKKNPHLSSLISPVNRNKLFSRLRFTKRIVDNRFFGKSMKRVKRKKLIILKKYKKVKKSIKLYFNKFKFKPLVSMIRQKYKRKPRKQYFYNTNKRRYRLDNKSIWTTRRFMILHIRKRLNRNLFNIRRDATRNRPIIKPKVWDNKWKIRRYNKYKQYIHAFRPAKV